MFFCGIYNYFVELKCCILDHYGLLMNVNPWLES